MMYLAIINAKVVTDSDFTYVNPLKPIVTCDTVAKQYDRVMLETVPHDSLGDLYKNWN